MRVYVKDEIEEAVQELEQWTKVKEEKVNMIIREGFNAKIGRGRIEIEEGEERRKGKK